MGANTKQNRLDTVGVVFAVISTIAVAGLDVAACFVPEITARGVFRPTAFLALPGTIRFGILVLGAIGLALLARKRIRTTALVLVICSAGSLATYRYIAPKNLALSRFLAEFARRVDLEIGPTVLDQTFQGVQNQQFVRVPNRALPAQVRHLFSSTPPVGYLNFDGTNVMNLQIRWGGPLMNWGIEIYNDVPLEDPAYNKVLIRRLYTNAVVFIGK